MAALAADGVALLHLAFIVFVGVGGFLAWRWPRLAWVHLPAAAWGALVSFTGWICPLTPLENALRRAAGRDEYAGGFVDRYLLPLIYPAGLTAEMQVGLGLALVIGNAVIYGLIWRRRRR